MKAKMLILEDDFFHRKLMTRLLKDHGDCTAVATGPDAVNAYRESLEKKEPFKVVFLDIMVPGMDGQKVLRAMREVEAELNIPADSHAKIVMVTALSDRQNITTAYQESCDAYLIKPYDEAKLIGTLQKLGVIQSQSAAQAPPVPQVPQVAQVIQTPQAAQVPQIVQTPPSTSSAVSSVEVLPTAAAAVIVGNTATTPEGQNPVEQNPLGQNPSNVPLAASVESSMPASVSPASVSPASVSPSSVSPSSVSPAASPTLSGAGFIPSS